MIYGHMNGGMNMQHPDYAVAGNLSKAQLGAQTKMPQIVSAINDLDKIVEVLRDEIRATLSRLEPAMEQVPQANGVEPSPVPPSSCELEARIRGVAIQLWRMRDEVQQARERLCI